MRKRLTPLERIEKRDAKLRGHYGNFQTWSPKVLRIDPKFAMRIYRCEKVWEFRKSALTLDDNVYLFETAPVNAITGVVRFDMIVASSENSVLDLVRKASPKRLDPPLDKETRAFLGKYAKSFETVFAHHIVGFKLFAKPIVAGVEDERGFWLDAPGNPIERLVISFRDGKRFVELLSGHRDDPTHYLWDDPSEAVARFERLRGNKEPAR